MIHSTLGRVSAGEDLSLEEMAAAVDGIMREQWQENEIAMLLTALRAKGETIEEVAGAARAMRQHMTPIRSQRSGLLDTCGTGGDGSATFNISTAAALVTAAAGVPVAKHGNRRVTSKTGSADVLAALGVNIEIDVATVEACLDELGIAFCFAPLCHRAMKVVAPVRQRLGVPTIFNLLGPLCNPAGAQYQLLGVGREPLRPLLAGALQLLGSTKALVVCGSDGLDEVTLTGPTRITEVTAEGLREFTWVPADFGIEPQPLDALKVDGPEASAAVIREVLAASKGPARDIVVLNAAAALVVAGQADSPRAAAAMVAEAIDSGAADALLARLAERTNA